MNIAANLEQDDVDALVRQIGESARAASRILARADAATKNHALNAAADVVRTEAIQIEQANVRDMAFAEEKGLNAALRDRLLLTAERIEAMASGLEEVAKLDDPVSRILGEWERPNGLKIARVSVPLGVIGIIYESRPNVTADAGGLCMKSGNAAILRGGSESFHSSSLITACLRRGLEIAGLPADCVQMMPTRDRAAVGAMLQMADLIDVIVPRGGRSLIERVTTESRIPVLAHLEGVCTVYVHEAANAEMAREIALNSKMRRTGVCGSAENLVIDRNIVAAQLPAIVDLLVEAGCEIRGDSEAQAIDDRIVPASVEDWSTEYLDAVIAVKVVDGLEDALAFIEHYGSHHTETIVTEDAGAADKFLTQIDSGIVLHNASTQFADGGEFGMGAEIGISTSKLHARGPVGAEQLTSYKYIVRGAGQCRS
jgi:glutamate-5-semialdehyde dehydrogenase